MLLIKMTCVNWIIVRERRAESTPLSHPDLAGSRGKTVSGHLELSPDAVDDHDFFCALRDDKNKEIISNEQTHKI